MLEQVSFCLPIYLSVDTWVAFILQLLWIMLLWTWMYKYLLEFLLSIFWGYISRSGIESYSNSIFNCLTSGLTVLTFFNFMSWLGREKAPHLLHSIKISANFLNFLFFIFWACHVACRILVLRPEIEPRPWLWKCQVLTTGPPGNSIC